MRVFRRKFKNFNLQATGVDTSNLSAKSDLVSLKAEVDDIDIDH